MHTTERVLTRMLEAMRESLPLLRPREGDARGQYFLLYYARLLELLDSALRLAGQTQGAAPVNVLLRSALECSVDLKNLAEQPAYVHVVRAMVLENRSAVFHFRTQPAYGELVRLCGQKAVEEMGQRAQNEFRTALKIATKHFPLLKNASRNLNVLNRFRIAGQEELYQTQYTFLSMVTHNDMTLMAMREALGQGADAAMDEALERIQDENAYNMILRFLVDALKYKTQVFGPDDELIHACLSCLDALRQKQARKAQPRGLAEVTG
ncbi:MAG: DUF5677 domain-containing protein [Candidatus Spyradocola sp.]|jgi:hypothetical protein